MSYPDETPYCRHCNRTLRGHAYWTGKPAYHPEPNGTVRRNHYGGWVCSRSCDWKAALDLEQSMPGHGYHQKTPGCYTYAQMDEKWGE
jgi:ribosomal protein L37AE/L43A